MSEQKWTTDPKAESVLASLKIKYTPFQLDLSKINWKATEYNAGRTGRPIDSGRVEEYSVAMIAGDIFPMPVAVKTEHGFEILAGVHRSKAAVQAALATSIQVYLATISLPHEPRMIACLTNRKEGVRVSKEEAIQQAIYLVTEYNLNVKNVAALFQVSDQTINDHIRANNIRKDAMEAGFKGILPISAIKNLTKIAGNTKVLAAACDYLSNSGSSADDAMALSKEVSKLKTEAQQIAKIESLVESHRKHTAVAQANPIILPVRTKFIRALHIIDTIIADRTTLKELQIVPQSDEHKAIKKEWSVLRAKINRIVG